MAGSIRIEITAGGYTHVALGQPRSDEAAERLWDLYRALRPETEALEKAARREGPRVAPAGAGGGR